MTHHGNQKYRDRDATAKARSTKRPSAKSAVAKKPSSLTIQMKVGAVTVEVLRPSKDEVKRNVSAGQAALSRVQSKLVQAGVRLQHPASVPLYHADPKDAGLLIRILRGKTSRGRFVGGTFQPAKPSQTHKKAA